MLYLTPFFPAMSNHRYDARTFDDVDPLLGGTPALAALSAEVHRRGMRIMGDLTTNHTGDNHEWFLAAQADQHAAEAGFYYWTDDEVGYAAWLGFPSLPKLNYADAELRRRLIDGPDSVVARWMRPPYGLDGWRIDVANMTGRFRADDFTHEVARMVRATMTAANPDTLLIAEHTHDYTGDLTGDGWHGVMNQSGFTRPIWRWLTDPHGALPNFLGVPGSVPRADGGSVVATIRDIMGAVPWRTATTTLNMLGSHDTPRIRTVTGDPELVAVGAALLFTFPGIPMVFSGDEIGLTGTNGEDSRKPFPWDRPERWEHSTLDTYRTLIRLRRDSVALRHGSLRWIHCGPDSLAYVRETADETVLVLVNRAAGPDTAVPVGALGLTGPAEPWYGGTPLTVHNGQARLPGDGPAAFVWRL